MECSTLPVHVALIVITLFMQKIQNADAILLGTVAALNDTTFLSIAGVAK
jgi:hypothetical protein